MSNDDDDPRLVPSHDKLIESRFDRESSGCVSRLKDVKPFDPTPPMTSVLQPMKDKRTVPSCILKYENIEKFLIDRYTKTNKQIKNEKRKNVLFYFRPIG